MESEACIAVEDEAEGAGLRAVEVSVPASTSNLGAGFDCFGLALRLYLTVRATVAPGASAPCRVRSRGEGASRELPRTADNLIYRAMQFAARAQGLKLPPVRLAVRNEIPLGGGLGSSAAAIIAGIKICSALCGGDETPDWALRAATRLEGHADNVAASLLGGLVITCNTGDGGVIALKKQWPVDIRVIVVSPHAALETTHARAALPRRVDRADAVYNLQRAALFCAALDARADDLLWEAMQDRLHQSHRGPLVPGLAAALATPRVPGLVGLALSGAGPSVLALARSHFAEIGDLIAGNFHRAGIGATVRLLEVDDKGTQIKTRIKGYKG
jgi:homoserine kinase